MMRQTHDTVKIAIPLQDSRLAHHFGHADTFALFDVDLHTHVILKRDDFPAPPHQPELLPSWLDERNVHLVIAGGMGKRAEELLQYKKISTVIGAEMDTPENLIAAYLRGTIKTGDNACSDCFTVSVKHPNIV